MSAGQLSLYIDLENGTKADLEVVARASLAYAAAVREIAAFIDPFSDTRVDLVDTVEGSLTLNTKIKFKVAGIEVEFTLYALILVLSTYLATHVTDVITDRVIGLVLDQAVGEQEAKLSEKDKQDIAEKAIKALEAKAGERQIRQLYTELERDPAVSGVGICKVPGGRPEHIVPRSEFQRRSGVTRNSEPPVKQRVQREVLNVILVSPVLENDRKRRWKFRFGDQEFGAPIKDHIFLDAVFSGKHPIIMKGNIAMRVALEWHEDFVNGVWNGRDYVVWSVISVPGQYQGPQDLLPFDDRPKTDRKPKRGK